MHTRRALAGTLLGSTVVASTLVAAPASADPPSGLSVQATCVDGNSYTMVNVGGATFTPQLVSGDTSVFLLTAYDWNVRTTAPDGTVTVYPPLYFERGSSDGRHPDATTCSYAYSLVSPDGTLIEVWGTAHAYVTPADR